MIHKMRENEGALSEKPDQDWFVYILRCRNNTFYTGITNNLSRRLKMHNDGKASRYTRVWRPVDLVYCEDCESRAHALVREYKVKSLPRRKKEDLVLGYQKALEERNQ